MKKNNKIASWGNAQNAEFYEHVPVGQLSYRASVTGLSDGQDLKNIIDHIKNADSILEIGAGTGRVLHVLSQLDYGGKLVAVERSRQLYDFLRSKYSNSAEIVNEDIETFQSNQKFDLILWLWSGICDFSFSEQSSVIKKVLPLLNPNGRLIIDTLDPASCPKSCNDSVESVEGSYLFQYDKSKLLVFIPGQDLLKEYCDKLSIKLLSIKSYKTTTGVSRCLYFVGG